MLAAYGALHTERVAYMCIHVAFFSLNAGVCVSLLYASRVVCRPSSNAAVCSWTLYAVLHSYRIHVHSGTGCIHTHTLTRCISLIIVAFACLHTMVTAYGYIQVSLHTCTQSSRCILYTLHRSSSCIHKNHTTPTTGGPDRTGRRHRVTQTHQT